MTPRAPGKTPKLQLFLIHPLRPLGADMGPGARKFYTPQPRTAPVLRVVSQVG